MVIRDLDLVCECLPIIATAGASIIKWINWNTHQKSLRILLESIPRHWSKIRDEREEKLLHDYCMRGNRIAYIYACIFAGVIISYISSPLLPKILDVLIPLNETRPHLFLYKMEYFVDQDKYYTPILVHHASALPIVATYMVIVDRLFCCFMHHASGLLEIVKDKLQNLHYDENLTPAENYRAGLKAMARCHEIQTDVIAFVEENERAYAMGVCGSLGFNMSLVSLTGYVLLTRLREPDEVLKIIIFNIGAMAHLSTGCWLGEVLLQQVEATEIAVYQGRWYEVNLRLQRILIAIIMRSQKPCAVSLAYLWPLGLQTFGALLRAAGSFFTLLWSTQ